MLILTLIIIVAVETGTVTDRVDVCACGGAGEYICILRRGTILTSTGCYGNLRTTGPGFVTGIDEMAMGHFDTVVIEKATLSCDSLGGLGQTTFVDGEACNKTTTTTTSSRPPTLTDVSFAYSYTLPLTFFRVLWKICLVCAQSRLILGFLLFITLFFNLCMRIRSLIIAIINKYF